MKKLYQFLTIFVCILTMYTAVLPTQAYTEEEKQAVKSWLSANGYPPTMEGAQQAYQDYLNGKFDSNGNRIPQTEPPADKEPPVTDKPDSPEKDKPSSGKNKKPGGSSGGDNASPDETGTGLNGSGGAGESEVSIQPDLIEALAESDAETDTGSESETESMETALDEKAAASTDSDFASEGKSETAESRNNVKKASAFTETAPLIIGPGLIVVIGGVLIAVKQKKR